MDIPADICLLPRSLLLPGVPYQQGSCFGFPLREHRQSICMLERSRCSICVEACYGPVTACSDRLRLLVDGFDRHLAKEVELPHVFRTILAASV